jgi:hypothetical protein
MIENGDQLVSKPLKADQTPVAAVTNPPHSQGLTAPQIVKTAQARGS